MMAVKLKGTVTVDHRLDLIMPSSVPPGEVDVISSLQNGEQSLRDVSVSLIPMCILLLGYGLIEKISPSR